jgi:hypothetical protein
MRSMKFIRKITVVLVVIGFVFSSGCRTVSVDTGPTVVMNNQGRIFVKGKYTGLKKMVKQLKEEGFPKKSTITVQIPENTSQNALKAISRELASNGYTHFLFMHARKPSVQLGPDPLVKHLYDKNGNLKKR